MRRPAEIRTVNARIGLARYSGASHQGWQVTVEDADAGIRLIELRLTDEQFGQVIGGTVNLPAEVTVDPEHIGKKLETRRERVPLSNAEAHDRANFSDNLNAAARDHQRDNRTLWPSHGWTAEVDRTFNHHRFNDDGYEVMFVRWVAQQEGSGT